MPETPDDAIRQCAALIETRAGRPEVADRGDGPWMAQLAWLLHAIADDMDFDGVTLATAQGGEPELLSGRTGYPLADWTRAYRLARAYLGGPS